MYLRLYLKTSLRNPYMWFWCIIFMTFWLLMGVVQIQPLMEEVKDLPAEAKIEVLLGYTGSWYAIVAQIALAANAIGLCYELLFASIASRYVVKYSRLTASRLYACHVTGYLIVSAFIALLLLAETAILYSWKISKDVLPRNIPGIIAISLATGLFYYVFATLVTSAVLVLRRASMYRFASFLPLMVGMGLGLVQVYANLGIWIIVSPINAIQSLFYSYYTNQPPRMAAFASREMATAPIIEPWKLWCSIIAWTVVLAVISIQLLKRQRGIGVEELRLAL